MKKLSDQELAVKIAEVVKVSGGETYYVGGLVRDKLLGKENKDIDIEIYGIDTARLTEILSRFGTVDTIGESFGILNIHGYGIDIAQPRKEQATGRGHKDLAVSVDPNLSTKAACERRDFTINALMENVLTGEIIDHFHGQEDLKAGIIRHVSDQTFAEDPLRVLRAAQFAARFGFEIAPETIELAKKADITTLPKERISGELFKAMLKADRPSIFFRSMEQMGHTEWLPELYDLRGVTQNPYWHPEGDAYTHTMNVIDHAAVLKKESSNPIRFMMSALCHDLGKKATYTIDENGVPHAYGHDLAGVPLSKTMLQRLTNETAMITYVENMVGLHMETHNTFNNKSRVRSTNEMFDKSIAPHDLILLSQSDNRGAAIYGIEAPDHIRENIEGERAWLEERFAHYKKVMEEPELTGKDLIKMGVKPGPDFTTALKRSHELHLAEVGRPQIEIEVKQILGIPIEKKEKVQIDIKEKQLEIINKYNMMKDDIHAGIKTKNDILFFGEALKKAKCDQNGDLTTDFNINDAKKALKNKALTIYSSYPIEQGVFVTPSKMEAQSYAGNGPIYEKTIDPLEVAWIDSLQGQYANVSEEREHEIIQEEQDAADDFEEI